MEDSTADADIDLWVFPDKGGQVGKQEIFAEGRADPDMQGAAIGPGQCLQLGLCTCDCREGGI